MELNVWILIVAAVSIDQGVEVATYDSKQKCMGRGLAIVSEAMKWASDTTAKKSMVFQCKEERR